MKNIIKILGITFAVLPLSLGAMDRAGRSSFSLENEAKQCEPSTKLRSGSFTVPSGPSSSSISSSALKYVKEYEPAVDATEKLFKTEPAALMNLIIVRLNQLCSSPNKLDLKDMALITSIVSAKQLRQLSDDQPTTTQVAPPKPPRKTTQKLGEKQLEPRTGTPSRQHANVVNAPYTKYSHDSGSWTEMNKTSGNSDNGTVSDLSSEQSEATETSSPTDNEYYQES